jgi:hypothetical protein
MTTSEYEHLNLRGWPFNIIPSEETAAVWVGRPELRRELRLLLRSASRVAASQIVLLWASFGQGKTHALRHLEGLAKEVPEILPLYTVIPEGITSFVEIYRAIADGAMESGVLVPAGKDLFDRTGGHGLSDMERAIVRIAMYTEDEARVAISWLRAEKVLVKDLKDIGIRQRIEKTADAIEALDSLIRTLQRDGSVKVLLLLDEMQELSDLGRRLPECTGGLHKVFDRNTRGLTMVMSFTTGTQAALRGVLGEALFDRASDVLTLAGLTRDESVELISGLLREWGIDPDKAPAPFTDDAIVSVVARLEKEVDALTPRTVIKAFNKILRHADLDFADGKLDEIDEAYALDHVSIDEED